MGSRRRLAAYLRLAVEFDVGPIHFSRISRNWRLWLCHEIQMSRAQQLRVLKHYGYSIA